MRRSKKLTELLEEKQKVIDDQMETIRYYAYRSNDMDEINVRIMECKEKLEEQNLYLRQLLWEEGWNIANVDAVDPSENYPFFGVVDSEAQPAEFFSDEATEKFFDERKKEIEEKKHKEEEIMRAREAAQQMQQGAISDKPTIQILKRPPACEAQPSSLQQDMAKLEEKTKTMTLQEREAAYLQARERIFGGAYRFEDDRNVAVDPNLQMISGAASSVSTGLLPHASYHTPSPRPRLPAMMRTPRPPLYQPPPLGMPPFGIPPPPGAYTPPLPPVPQQRFPLATGMQHPPSTQPQQRFPYFDSRIPPPAAPPATVMGQTTVQSSMGINPVNPLYGDPVRNNPVPYGRPPAQLLSQNQFTPAFNDQSNRFY